MNYQEAINRFDGNISAMARALDVSRQTIYNWASEGELPKHRAMQLEYYLQTTSV
jgi:DNA-binding XRE family transcriptional regulator